MKKAIAALLLVASAAHAEFYTGNDIYNFMTSGTNAERALSIGYVAGVFDVYSGISICAPDGVTLGQMRDVVRQYLAANAQRRHLSAQHLIYEVLSAAYPCQSKGRNL